MNRSWPGLRMSLTMRSASAGRSHRPHLLPHGSAGFVERRPQLLQRDVGMPRLHLLHRTVEHAPAHGVVDELREIVLAHALAAQIGAQRRIGLARHDDGLAGGRARPAAGVAGQSLRRLVGPARLPKCFAKTLKGLAFTNHCVDEAPPPAPPHRLPCPPPTPATPPAPRRRLPTPAPARRPARFPSAPASA